MFLLTLLIGPRLGWNIRRKYDGMYDKYMHYLWGCRMHRWHVPIYDCRRIAEWKEQHDNVYSEADIEATMKGWLSFEKGVPCGFGMGVIWRINIG